MGAKKAGHELTIAALRRVEDKPAAGAATPGKKLCQPLQGHDVGLHLGTFEGRSAIAYPSHTGEALLSGRGFLTQDGGKGVTHFQP
ncbi:MAG: hypothetical protein R6U88_02965, partial [Candidatus Bipolaricaulota bacterium]